MGAWGLAIDGTLAVLCGLVSLSLYLRMRLSRAREQRLALESEAARMQRALTLAQRQLTLFEAEQQFMSQFLREFPHLTADLHGGVSERGIPRALLNIVVRVLQPRQAVVLLRRHKAESDPTRSSRLLVAAASPADGALRTGQEIAFGDGAIGLVAASQRAMDQRDFEEHWRHAGVTPQGLDAFEVELAAPMVLGHETVGVLAVSGAPRSSSEAKDVLRLIAQVGALATHYVSAYTQVKVTADLDGLTGVYNKRHVTEVLSDALLRAQQQVGSSLAVFLFDVDHFKHYNDTNGHAAGDQLLAQLARLVEDNMRKEDAFGRFGGEEFLLVLPNTTPEQALIVAEKVRYLIAHHSFPAGESQPLGFVTVSGGIAAYPLHGGDAGALLEAADTGLYEAKRQGRNRVLSGRGRRPALEAGEPPFVPKERHPGEAVSWDWTRE